MSRQTPRWRPAPSGWPGGRVLSCGAAGALLAILALGLLGPGCFPELIDTIDRNQPPQTLFVAAPPDTGSSRGGEGGSISSYRSHLYWTGTDNDGVVVAFEWAITDSAPTDAAQIEYRRTLRSDSVFIFPVGEQAGILGHRFYIRSIDNEGKLDPTPAWTFFAVRDSTPWVRFTRAFAAGPSGIKVLRDSSGTGLHAVDTLEAGSSVRFSWRGYDGDKVIELTGDTVLVGRATGFYYKLAPIDASFIGGLLSDTTRSYSADELSAGVNNVFTMFLRCRDDAGFSSSPHAPTATRTFVWNYDPKTRFTEGPSDTAFTRRLAASTNGRDYSFHDEGDTLPLTGSGVKVRTWVWGRDPDSPKRINGYQARVFLRSELWNPLALPASPLNAAAFEYPAGQSALYTGDYYLMASAQDAWGRWDGSPDSIRFYINRAPRFRSTWAPSKVQRPRNGDVITATVTDTNSTAYVDTLKIRFGATDPDHDPGVSLAPYFSYYFARYPLPGGGTGSSGSGTEFVKGRLGSDGSTYFLDVSANLQPNSLRFIPGSYTLVVVCRDTPNTPDWGYRDVPDTVRFTLRDPHLLPVRGQRRTR